MKPTWYRPVRRSLPILRREPHPMPFATTYQHEYWSVAVRQVEDHRLDDPKPVYAISVLKNYSGRSWPASSRCARI